MVYHRLKAENDTLFAAIGSSLKRVHGDHVLEYKPRDTGFFHTILLTKDYILAVHNDDKEVHVLNKSDMSVVSVRSFPKKPVSLDVIKDTLLVGDKFGDVYTAQITSVEPVVDGAKGIIDPVLGHVSMLSDVLAASNQGKDYIITADRDEHIRVTRFPQTFVIERFLLAHTEFLSAVRAADNLLVSGGGDDFVALWDWTTGQLIDTVNIRETVGPHLDESHDSVRDKEAPREITIADIVLVGQSAYILPEGTALLLKLEFTADKMTLTSTKQFDSKIVAIADNSGNGLYLSLENGQVVKVDNEMEIQSTLDQPALATDSVPPLFGVKQLRKRAEN